MHTLVTMTIFCDPADAELVQKEMKEAMMGLNAGVDGHYFTRRKASGEDYRRLARLTGNDLTVEPEPSARDLQRWYEMGAPILGPII